MDQAIVNNAIEYVKGVFKDEYSGHDYFHTMRVYVLATRIAKEENADLLVVQLAALLHDVDDIKLSPETHANKSRTVGFLAKHGASKQLINEVCKIIDEVSFKGTDSVVPQTIEGKCVQDADRLDAIGAIGIARTFAYGGNHRQAMYDPSVKPLLNVDEKTYRNHVSTTINHFYEKLFLLKEMMNTAAARKIAEQRHEYMKQFVERFLNEWNGNC